MDTHYDLGALLRTAVLAAAVVVPMWMTQAAEATPLAEVAPLVDGALPPEAPSLAEGTLPHEIAPPAEAAPLAEAVGPSEGPQLRPQQLQQSLVPKRSTVQRPAYQSVIDDVERGIASGSVAEFSAHLPLQISISLRGEGSGTYSSNQAYYLLDQFFRLRRFTGCKLSTVGESGATPFATGSASFTLKGARETAQVYVSLARSGDRWIIAQINIY